MWANAAGAQTAWPDYMADLVPALSESPVAAVLPPDVVITPPSANLPADNARWSGLWHGWACRVRYCDVKLAVEKLSATGATVYYAGATAGQVVTERVEAEFIEGELVLLMRTGGQIVFRMRASGDVEMSLWRKPESQPTSAESANPQRQLISTGVLTQKTFDYTRTIERVPTPWSQDGKPQTLEMVVHRPHGPGPFPTLVFNHGSTGNGDRADWFSYTWTAPEISGYFVGKGWQVFSPQRRGRGKSDGVYDEGFEADRSRYACQPELTLPGLERAMVDLDTVMAHLKTRPDVDAQRVVIGGVSRGGILSVAYAGTRAHRFLGVLNFVGGWVGDRCPQADSVNPVSFKRGAAFGKPMLWLYGDRDPFYSLRHSRKNFEAFQAAGGKGNFLAFEPPSGQNGHGIHANPAVWRPALDNYLEQITAR